MPLTLVVMWLTPSGISLANPKSATSGSKLESRRTLLAFMSLWIMWGVTSWCKYLCHRSNMLEEVGFHNYISLQKKNYTCSSYISFIYAVIILYTSVS